MACCQKAPSHYLNQCWHIISKGQWHLSEGSVYISMLKAKCMDLQGVCCACAQPISDGVRCNAVSHWLEDNGGNDDRYFCLFSLICLFSFQQMCCWWDRDGRLLCYWIRSSGYRCWSVSVSTYSYHYLRSVLQEISPMEGWKLDVSTTQSPYSTTKSGVLAPSLVKFWLKFSQISLNFLLKSEIWLKPET